APTPPAFRNISTTSTLSVGIIVGTRIARWRIAWGRREERRRRTRPLPTPYASTRNLLRIFPTHTITGRLFSATTAIRELCAGGVGGKIKRMTPTNGLRNLVSAWSRLFLPHMACVTTLLGFWWGVPTRSIESYREESNWRRSAGITRTRILGTPWRSG